MPTPDPQGLIDVLQQVGGWDGFEVAGVTTDETPLPDVHGVQAPRLVIELRPVLDHVKRCGQCGAAVTRVHETTTRDAHATPARFASPQIARFQWSVQSAQARCLLAGVRCTRRCCSLSVR